jgi:hypothetical protein
MRRKRLLSQMASFGKTVKRLSGGFREAGWTGRVAMATRIRPSMARRQEEIG